MISTTQNNNQILSIIVDDNQDFCSQLKKSVQFSNAFNLFENNNELIQYTSLKISEKLTEEINGNNSIPILINIEGKYNGSKRQDQKGIEILLWLRCRFDVRNPVIVYSFQSIHQLLNKKPENFIICSQGCYHFRLPYNFNHLNLEKLEPVKDPNELKKYLKPAFSIDEFRHREANWWGVKCLWDSHKIFTKGVFNSDYPEIIKSKLKELNNCIADFCFGIGLVRVDDYLTKLENDLTKEKEISNKTFADKEKEVINCKNQYLEALKILDNEKKISVIIVRKLKQVFRLSSPQDREAAESLVRDTKIEYDKRQYELEEIKRKGKELSLKNVYQSAEDKIFKDDTTKGVLKNMRILHIDDQVINGWSDIIQYIVYNVNNSDNYFTFEFDNSFNINDKIEEKIWNLFEKLKKIIISPSNSGQFNPDVILLDLRLFPTYDELHKHDVGNMSGAQLLKMLREEYLGIPIIVTTASNKVWTYVKLIEFGADAYWIKEGLDEQYDFNYSIKNYQHLLRLLTQISNDHYKLLKSIDNVRMQIRAADQVWWENVKWPNKDQTTCDRERIIYLLENIATKTKVFLQRSELGIGFNNQKSYSLEASSIINNVGLIVEALHFQNTTPKSRKLKKIYTIGDNKKTYPGRNDYISYLAYQYRNIASHLLNYSCNNFNYVMQPVKLILYYLARPNYQTFGYLENDIPHNDSWEILSDAYSKLIEINNIDIKDIWD